MYGSSCLMTQEVNMVPAALHEKDILTVVATSYVLVWTRVYHVLRS